MSGVRYAYDYLGARGTAALNERYGMVSSLFCVVAMLINSYTRY